MQTSAITLAPVSSCIAVRRRKRVSANYLRAFCLLLAWLLLLLAALASEMAVAFASGTAVRVLFVDIPAHKYDSALHDR